MYKSIIILSLITVCVQQVAPLKVFFDIRLTAQVLQRPLAAGC